MGRWGEGEGRGGGGGMGTGRFSSGDFFCRPVVQIIEKKKKAKSTVTGQGRGRGSGGGGKCLFIWVFKMGVCTKGIFKSFKSCAFIRMAGIVRGSVGGACIINFTFKLLFSLVLLCIFFFVFRQ